MLRILYYKLTALGAMRLLRNRHRVIPDEASYRALMVACGRVDSDRRVEIVKLFGMLRSDDIFPSALTLGQYTKSIAEGFSKSNSNSNNDNHSSNTYNNNDGGSIATTSTLIMEGQVSALDTNLAVLEQAGLGWRRNNKNRGRNASSSGYQSQSANWIPILSSSSFSEGGQSQNDDYRSSTHVPREEDFRVVALWSKVTSCETCDYIPLDEEIQAGWETSTSSETNTNEIPGAIACPRCGSVTMPMIGYRVMNLSEAISNRCNEVSPLSSSPSSHLNHQRQSVSVSNHHSNHHQHPRVSQAERMEHIVASQSMHGQSAQSPNKHFETAWESSSSVASYQFDSGPLQSQSQSQAAEHNAIPNEIQNDAAGGNSIIGTCMSSNPLDTHDNATLDHHHFDEREQQEQQQQLDLPAQLIYAKQNSGASETIDIASVHAHSVATGSNSFTENHGFVPYMDPSTMRTMLEQYMDERGEAGLDRDTMRRLNPRLFFNLWWFSARFSLPLPLLTRQSDDNKNNNKRDQHYCAFALWDEVVGMKGCASAASFGSCAIAQLLSFWYYIPSAL